MLRGSTNEEKIWNYGIAQGCNEYGIAGFMGNTKQESNNEPVMLQITFQKSLGMTSKQYMDAVDKGTYSADKWAHDGAGWGLPQYTYHSLKTEFLNYCKKYNKSIGDLEIQLEYMFIVIKRDCKSLWNVLQNATSVREASNKMLFEFEIPGDQGIGQQNKRAAYGEEYYAKFAKGEDKKEETKLQNAKKLNKSKYRKDFVTKDDLNIRYGAGTDYKSMAILPKGTVCHCYGYYMTEKSIDWLLVVATAKGVTYTGYVSSYWLKEA